MAANPPSNSKRTGSADQDPTPVLLEDRLQQAWPKYRNWVIGGCALVLVAILANGIWDKYQRSKEADVEAAFAAATTNDQLKAFAGEYPNHELAGIAYLQVADSAYAAGKSSDALSAYDQAAAKLKTGPLAARARLGRALAKVQAGNSAEGSTELKEILNDTTQFNTVRTEAAYQLASLAADQGNTTDVQKYIDQLNQIDPAGQWAQRAMALRASLPMPAPISVPAAKKSDTSPGVKIDLPKK